MSNTNVITSMFLTFHDNDFYNPIRVASNMLIEYMSYFEDSSKQDLLRLFNDIFKSVLISRKYKYDESDKYFIIPIEKFKVSTDENYDKLLEDAIRNSHSVLAIFINLNNEYNQPQVVIQTS